MIEIIEAKEDWKELNQQEKTDLERIAKTTVPIEFARKWAKRELQEERIRSNSIQITLEEKPMAKNLLGKLVKEEIVRQFGWDESEFNVAISYSKERKVLNVMIDLIGI